ncbi:ExeA family protein [Gimesia panareensis]|uniref:Uncharacterized protein n=1 Tax=Gimesia panareensis TaxID=2527978 RepID=A0A517Q0L7_9PLAN|nr:hypothetical protein [Gimesia panareensis]QDT25161.1 hypothetical protein Enr10x_04560 [Gimesia panareensis]QDU48126.1 hypothetical protein Pan110_04390 [Gimesia panareensis]
MYYDFWNLSQAPFSQQQDLALFFESELHEEALARLLFVAEEQKKCSLFAGPSGTGKSITLKACQQILTRSPWQCEYLDLLGLEEEEFLWQLCATLRLGPAQDTPLPQLWRQLTDCLTGMQLTQGRLLLLLDHVDQSRLESLHAIERLLHSGTQQFPSLSLVLAMDDLNSARAERAARISDLSIELAAFDAEMTENYIQHRLSLSGCADPLFTSDAVAEIQNAAQGIPARINQICDLALLAGYEQNLNEIGIDVIRRAVREINGTPAHFNRISEVIQGV